MSRFTNSPVIVMSPAVRAGTTLVQRLLCSAPNTLIYGDTAGQEVEFFARYAAIKTQVLYSQQQMTAPVRSAVLAGDVSDFITPLAPALSAHIEGLRDAAMAWLRACEKDAQSAARPVWGWKLAGADAVALASLAQWFPEARWVWVTRDLADCYRSAKAAGMVHSAADAVNFRRSAEAALTAFTPLESRALHLNYEAMVSDPEGTVRLLETHTGAAGIDAAVFAKRVNQTGSVVCVPPADLSPEESAVFAGPSIVPLPQPFNHAA